MANEDQPVWVLHDGDTRELRVILMRDAVVQGLEHGRLIVLLDLALDELTWRQEPDLVVSDVLVKLRGGENEGDGEVLVGAVLLHEAPSDFRHVRVEEIGGLGLAQQEDGSAREAPFGEEAEMAKELLVFP